MKKGEKFINEFSVYVFTVGHITLDMRINNIVYLETFFVLIAISRINLNR